MALYEYECDKCGERFTVQQTFDEHTQHPKPKCPKCQSRKVSHLMDSVHVKTSHKS